jgi:hypothetical protein
VELRPLVGFTYWLEYRLWRVNPLGYHLTNLSLYLLTLVGFYCVVRETARALLEKSVAKTAIGWIAIAAAILFLYIRRTSKRRSGLPGERIFWPRAPGFGRCTACFVSGKRVPQHFASAQLSFMRRDCS